MRLYSFKDVARARHMAECRERRNILLFWSRYLKIVRLIYRDTYAQSSAYGWAMATRRAWHIIRNSRRSSLKGILRELLSKGQWRTQDTYVRNRNVADDTGERMVIYCRPKVAKHELRARRARQTHAMQIAWAR